MGPDDPVVFNIVLGRVLLHPFKGLVHDFDGCFAVFVARDGIMFLIFVLLFGMLVFAMLMTTSVNCWIGASADSVTAEFQSCLM